MLTNRHRKQMIPVIIYGAGQSGCQLLEAIKQVSEYNAVAFVDDNTAIQRMVIYDLPVHKPSEIGNLINRYGVEKILLAIPSASTGKCAKTSLHQTRSLSLRSAHHSGHERFGRWQNQRQLAEKKFPVVGLTRPRSRCPRSELMAADISGKVVMVTGTWLLHRLS